MSGTHRGGGSLFSEPSPGLVKLPGLTVVFNETTWVSPGKGGVGAVGL